MSYRYIGTVDFGIDFEEIRERDARYARYLASLSHSEIERMRKIEEINYYIEEIEKLETSLKFGLCGDREYVKEGIEELKLKILEIEKSMY